MKLCHQNLSYCLNTDAFLLNPLHFTFRGRFRQATNGTKCMLLNFALKNTVITAVNRGSVTKIEKIHGYGQLRLKKLTVTDSCG